MKLTNAEIKQAVDAFKNVVITHDQQQATLSLAMFMLEYAPNAEIVNLVGPTGIGKSQLQLQIIDLVYSRYREEMLVDRDLVPIIRTLALAAGYRQFDWKSLYRGGLAALGDPFSADRKALPGNGGTRKSQFAYAGEGRTASELRMLLEEEFRRRKTKYWIIDEAQHAVFGGKSGWEGDQFDVLKSIAQSSGVKLLLAGPQEMEAGLTASGQLARRSITVHYKRYAQNDTVQVKQFVVVVVRLFKEMRVAGYPSVRENAKFFYSGCAGCVGVLKDWLARAYGLALHEQSEDAEQPQVTLAHLKATRLPYEAMKTIMNDIRLAEEKGGLKMAEDEAYERLVMGPPDVQSAKSGPTSAASVVPHSGVRPTKRSTKARPGTRSPGRRDKVGVDQVVAEEVVE